MIWTTVEVPGTWLDAVITRLHKKGLKSIAKNHYSIFIMNAKSRILPRQLSRDFMTATNRLLWKTSLVFAKPDQQLMLFLLSMKLLSPTNTNPLYLCMIDLRAVYDHVIFCS